MVADWRQNQPKRAKKLPEKSGGGFGLFGDFSTHPARIRTREVLASSKIKSLIIKILRGACAWNGCGLLKPPSGLGL